MSTIKERAAALNLAEKLCVRPQGTVIGAACFGVHQNGLPYFPPRTANL